MPKHTQNFWKDLFRKLGPELWSGFHAWVYAQDTRRFPKVWRLFCRGSRKFKSKIDVPTFCTPFVMSLSLSLTRFHLWAFHQFTEEITGAFLHQPCFPDPKCNSERVGTLGTGQISEGLTISWRSKSWGLWKVRTFFQYKIWKHLLLIALRLRHWIRGSPVHV